MNSHREFASHAPSIGRSWFDGTGLMRFFAAFLISMAASFPVGASGQMSAAATYKELMEKGRNELNESYAATTPELSVRHASEAVKLFQAAEKLRPNEPEPVFFEGVAFIAAKNYCCAVQKIERAKRAGYQNPFLSFELGMALVNCGSLTEGIANLREFLSNGPAGPDHDAAQTLLQHALELQASPKSALSKLAAAPNVTASPSSKTPPPPKLTFSIISGLGYNNNLLKIGRNAALPAGILERETFYNESGFALGADWSSSHRSGEVFLADKFSLGYALTADTYDEFRSKDQILQTAFATYSRSLTPWTKASLRVSDVWIRIDGSNFSNNIAAQPALTYTPDDRFTLKVSYVFNGTDFYTPTTPSADPDGVTHRADLAPSYVLVQDPCDKLAVLTIEGVYGHEWTLTNGIGADMQRDDLLAKVTWNFFHAREHSSFLQDAILGGSYNRRFDHYAHATFPTATALNRFRRSDDTGIAAIALNLKMWYDQAIADEGIKAGNRLEAILQYQFTSKDSNVTAKEYDQNYVIASLKFNF